MRTQIRKNRTVLRSKALSATAAGLILPSYVVAHASKNLVDCPPTHNGKALTGVELFEGDPADKIELMPEDGRFVVPEPLPTDPNYTLGCTYRGSKDMVTVILPRHISVCAFPNYPHVKCQ